MADIMHDIDELTQGKGLVLGQDRGILRITGQDGRDFLQRMSTNDLNNLTNKSPLHTSFVNSKGRIIDHCLLFEIDAHQIIIVSSYAHGQILYDWLSQFHFVEDLVITDVSKEFSFSYVIVASQTYEQKNHLAFKCWEGKWIDFAFDFYAHLKHCGSKTLQVCHSRESGNPDKWNRDWIPASTGMTTFEILRIVSLMPISPFEINHNFMPQNINLERCIADNKGCYIGQEVIAKARTYQKNVKSLCGALFSPHEFSQATINSRVESPDGDIGVITSIAPTYVEGIANALVITDSGQKAPSSNQEIIKAAAPFIRKANNLC